MIPAWATAWGQDPHGLYADLAVGEVVQRLRWIPPGAFLMGSPPDEPGRFSDEGPQHRVTLSRGLWLGDTPVTQALWTAAVGQNPSHFPGERRPVEQVSWEDCRAFCAALPRVEDGLAWRLPTEAEWEHACRAGRGWPGPEVGLEDVAWYGANSGGRTHDVGTKAANPWGLFDVLGNVWEWCHDAAQRTYEEAEVVDPVHLGGAYRVLRGGSWYVVAQDCRAASRLAYPPAHRDDALGFRLARGLPVPEALPAGPAEPGRGGEGAAGPEGRSRRPSVPRS